MTVFKNAKELYECIGGLFDWAKEDPAVSANLATAGFVVRLNYTEPDCAITIDLRNKVEWHKGEAGLAPEVEFSMCGDVGHRFWLGKVNLLFALAKRDVRSKGPVHKALKLLPKLKPLYAQYPKVLAEKGRRELAAV